MENIINNPSHYCEGIEYEPKDVIRDWKLDFFLGNVVKYIARAGRKDGNSRLQDLLKAKQYLDWKIEELTGDDTEEWRPIEGFENFVISNRARVKNLLTQHILNPSINSTGYLVVNLKYDNKSHVKTLHRLFATAFIPNEQSLPCVNHIDGDKTNCSADNLEWCTYSQNIQHAYDTGLNNGVKKPVSCYSPNGELLRTFASVSEAANDGFHSYMIERSANDETGLTLSYGLIWKWEEQDIERKRISEASK